MDPVNHGTRVDARTTRLDACPGSKMDTLDFHRDEVTPTPTHPATALETVPDTAPANLDTVPVLDYVVVVVALPLYCNYNH